MRRLSVVLLVLATLGCGDAETATLPAPTRGPAPEPTIPAPPPVAEATGKLPQIDKIMRAYDGDVPGASVLVVQDGKVVVRRAYGLANLENDTPATPATNNRLASVSKHFTAAAVLLLAEEGKLRLDDRARRWLPSLPKDAEAVTIRHLLTHTSGVADYEELMDEEGEQLSDAGVLDLLEDQELDFAPGTKYNYSNSGYALLALIVEQASGERFADFLRDRIFRPLGMNGSVAWEKGRSEIAHRAYGYARRKKTWKLADQDVTSAILGDGGIYSSIDDLARWDAALASGRLLSKKTLAEAMAGQVDTDERGTRYGYGWHITDDIVWHSGEMIGFRTVFQRHGGRLTVALLTNRDEGAPSDLADRIAELFLPD